MLPRKAPAPSTKSYNSSSSDEEQAEQLSNTPILAPSAEEENDDDETNDQGPKGKEFRASSLPRDASQAQMISSIYNFISKSNYINVLALM